MHFFKFRFGKILRYVLIGLAAFGLVAGSFYYGFSNGRAFPNKVSVEYLNADSKDKIAADFGIFWEALNLLKKEHIKGGSVEDRNWIYGAIRGLVGTLGDANTVFLPPDDSKKFEEDVKGSFGGIGAEIGLKNNQLVIIAPLKNTPAEKAGLRPGDKILSIEGKSTEGLDVNEAVKKIRGESGTVVTLSVFRDGWGEPKDIKITRATIEVPTLEWDYFGQETAKKIVSEELKGVIERGDKQIAHLKLFSFNQNAPLAFYKAALRVLLSGIDGIVFDLRNNPGGFLEVSANLAGWFLPKGQIIVTERFKSGQEIVFRANGNEALTKIPTVVLVNKGSASASEILAGALRANRGIKLVGTTTFGKGTVQELRQLSDGSKIKVTIANWVLPDGTIINDQGIKPDVEMELKEEDIKNEKDPQLEKAIEVLLEEIK